MLCCNRYRQRRFHFGRINLQHLVDYANVHKGFSMKKKCSPLSHTRTTHSATMMIVAAAAENIWFSSNNRINIRYNLFNKLPSEWPSQASNDKLNLFNEHPMSIWTYFWVTVHRFGVWLALSGKNDIIECVCVCVSTLMACKLNEAADGDLHLLTHT